MSTNESAAIDYFDTPQSAIAQEPATLEALANLAVESKELERQISEVTVALAELVSRNDRILRVRIPAIMETLGLEEYKLIDGSKVTVKQDVKCGITEERKPEAFAWLRQTSNDGIIKTQVSLAFGKGEQEAVKKAMEVLKVGGFEPTVGESVHPQTLKSFVKECLEDGVNIPIDTFGVFEFKQAKIALPKTRASKR